MSDPNKSLVRFAPWGLVFLWSACSPKQPSATADGQPAKTTNRLPVPPAVVNNLGITFEVATRGRLGAWHEVPGQLEVPESQRWILRAPARARVTRVVARWQRVQRGDEVATLESPEVLEAHRAIEFAERTLDRATVEMAAARDRLAESEAQLREAGSYEEASRQRLQELVALGEQGNAFTAREVIEARREVTDAGKARLDAAIARDELTSRVADKQLQADQARQSVAERLSALSVLTGSSVEELSARSDQGPAWRQVRTLGVRAAADGVVVELLTAPGEIVEAGAAILHVFDTRELRFRGRVPEGDLGTLMPGDRVRLEFAARSLPVVVTRLEPPLPIADARTRMVLVEAVVANQDGALAHGMSALARVLVEESENEEVLLPRRCVVFDGLEAIVFKRDPDDQSVVIRTPVELGARAGGHVEVFSGVLDGDVVVADGVHQLKQAGLGKAPEGGHFHADGTWHEDHK